MAGKAELLYKFIQVDFESKENYLPYDSVKVPIITKRYCHLLRQGKHHGGEVESGERRAVENFSNKSAREGQEMVIKFLFFGGDEKMHNRNRKKLICLKGFKMH